MAAPRRPAITTAPAIIRTFSRRRLPRRLRRVPLRALVATCALLALVLPAWTLLPVSHRAAATTAPSVLPPSLTMHVPPSSPLSALVLFHGEHATLNHTLHTWHASALHAHLTEVVLFLNGATSGTGLSARVPLLAHVAWRDKVRVHVSPRNLPLGLAISRMVELATSPVVLLLEKDWALIEPRPGPPLAAARRLVEDRVAHVVRFRHRNRPGAPLHARIMHEGRESQMMAQQPNLFCYLHHWVSDPVRRYPEYFSRCSPRPEDEGTWCAKARYCQWTNNPAMFRKDWFRENLANKYERMYNETVLAEPTSSMLDFEFFMNWKNDVWNDRDFVVALPFGLFEHQEIGEQNLMNTVWYAWNRLNTDVEEKMRAFFAGEAAECHATAKSLTAGETYVQKFPIDFVRMYHYDRAMQRSVHDAVQELEAKALEMRTLLEDGHGSWRHGITELTNLWYKVVLYTYPLEPSDMRIAFVTALFSTTGGDEAGAAEPDARHIDRACANLNSLAQYQLVVYCSEDTKGQVLATLKSKYNWDDQRLSSIEFSVHSLDDMVNALLGVENVERIKKVRGRKAEWEARVKERSGGVVPTVEEVSLSMSKPYILHDAMRRGLSRGEDRTGGSAGSTATHHVWFDAVSQCVDTGGKRESLSRANDHVLRGHMLLNALVSGVRLSRMEDVEAALSGSGFSTGTLLHELEIDEEKVGSGGVSMVDFKTLGGSHLSVTLLKGYYDVVLRDMLRRGEVGTGREALSIAVRNVGYTFRFFNGVAACRSGDTMCGAATDVVGRGYMREDAGSGCKLYQWAISCSGAGR